MKSFILLSLLFSSAGAFASWKSEARSVLKEYRNECRNSIVSVDEIVKDSHIKGRITGLPTDALDKFKVIFYVKTNRWYVHPYTYYEGQEEGYSYSNLTANGEFWVRTVSRKIPSKQLAVAVVPKSYKMYSQKFWLRPLFGIFGGVLKYQCAHTIVKGNGDFFM